MAAKEIKVLINGSVKKVEEGGVLVDGAGNTMNKIIQSVEQAAPIMSEISAASQEQSSGIESVSRSIGEMHEQTIGDLVQIRI
jgi:methyl-accepting chemotaxis protein